MARLISKSDTKKINNHSTLGQMVNHFPVHNYLFKRWFSLLLGCGLVLGTIGLSVHLILTTWARIIIHGRAVILTIFPLPTAAYGIVFIVGILLIIHSIIHWNDSITLYEKGFVQSAGKKEQTREYAHTNRFDSHITQIMFGGSVVSTKERIILENGSNRRWVIRRPYTYMDKLIQTLRQNILPGLILRARQQLSEGAVLTFHKYLQASGSGLEFKDDQIAFADVGPEIENGVLKLHKIDQTDRVFFKSKVTHIKNLDVLIDFLENPPG